MQYRLIDWKAFVTVGMILLSLATLSYGPSVSAAGHSVTRITLDPPTPNVLTHNQRVTISFSYATTQPGGVRIFARPLRGERPRPATPLAERGYLQPGAARALNSLPSHRVLSRWTRFEFRCGMPARPRFSSRFSCRCITSTVSRRERTRTQRTTQQGIPPDPRQHASHHRRMISAVLLVSGAGG